MKAIAALLILSIASVAAKQPPIKPSDFQPLTSLPWMQPNATFESVLRAIFLEPDARLRAAVLAQYLTLIPVEQFGKALDLSIELEGSQTPNDLVEEFLYGWAIRDPEGCWKRTQELIHVAGIEDGWLNYDSWLQRPAITVQDLAAIRLSPFYLESSAFEKFPLGINASSLPKVERLKIMRDFAELWFVRFGTWPGGPTPSSYLNWGTVEYAFDGPLEGAPPDVTARSLRRETLVAEVKLRRWIVAHPESASEIITKLREATLDPVTRQSDSTGIPSPIELLMLWSKIDQAGMIQWAESLNEKDDFTSDVRGFLMSRVNDQTRQRWLAKGKMASSEKGDFVTGLFEGWAQWDPLSALRAVDQHAGFPDSLISQAAYGPWLGRPTNTSLYGLSVITTFPFEKLGKKARDTLLEDCYRIMEQWGDLDVGETARFGMHVLLGLQPQYAPREKLIAFFSGEDVYPDEGGTIDRTFCALRVWAVIRPEEMTTWIKTIKDAKMRKALTWLHDHPWGSGPEE